MIGCSAGTPPLTLLKESSERMNESPLIKRLMWSGLLAGTGALATLMASRISAVIWKRLFDEEPPE